MSKPPILLIHGFRGSHEGLSGVKAHLESAGYEVFCPDIPPFGHTKPLKSGYSPKTYTDFIANYINEHQLEKPILAGHSMGSVITAAVAETYPELISEKIIFLAPISGKPPKVIARLEPLLMVLPNKVIGFCSTQYMSIDRSLLRQVLEITYRCGEFHNHRSDLLAAAKFSSNYCIADFDLKDKTALFLAGEKDRLESKRLTEKTANSRQNSTAVFLKNTGHLLNYERPRETAAEIIKFLSL